MTFHYMVLTSMTRSEVETLIRALQAALLQPCGEAERAALARVLHSAQEALNPTPEQEVAG